MFNKQITIALFAGLVLGMPLFAQQQSDTLTTADRPMHTESAQEHAGDRQPEPESPPPLPEGMTLEEVFEYAETPPPSDYPDSVPDDKLYLFTMFEQFEYRTTNSTAPDHLGWEAQGWFGRDFGKFWWKNESEVMFGETNEGETETDFLYSRLMTPFWNIQAGVQYANEWMTDEYEDRWSGVIALQGLAPYKFELDNSLYLSQHGNVTLALEAEYDLRITQRLVAQPLAAVGAAFQDIPERGLGAGITGVNLDVRLRYEIKREFAPYLGIRSHFLVGETKDIASSAGEDSEQILFFSGLRFAF
ncbi:MAG: copper resistance protein B [Candidatus Marinimicrobia bacterium]|nr:copper resistance protein B [Candidatus Neomarinimicrobiota bacterium]MCF7830345.1 copper resistance protein B [Candidatus Neomarinimicrobiota bacterium]MCF7882413.1 copper resistance protein B [Candidatus Neomarinimicrobiota bacterium]